jgi:hypothetical protein
MSDHKISVAELARLVAIEQHRVLSLSEVSEVTGFSLRWLEKECRAKRLEHTHEGNTRGMTLAQVDLLVASRRSGTTQVALHSTPNAPSSAIASSRRAAARSRRPAA